MKKTFLAFAAAFATAVPAFALVGGPWDGDVAGNPTPVNPSSASGTYQGSIRGPKGSNTIGVMMFGTDATSVGSNVTTTTTTTSGTNSWSSSSTFASSGGLGTSGNEGRFVLFVNGRMAVGMLTSVIDLPGKKLSGVMEGSASGPTRSIAVPLTSATTVVTTSTSTTTNTIPRTLVTTITDVTNLSGFFSAKLQSPAMSYSGKGTVTVTGVDIAGLEAQLFTDPETAFPQLTSTSQTITVSGVRSSTEPPKFTGTLTIDQPTVTMRVNSSGTSTSN